MADANELLYKVEYESYLHNRIESEEHVRSVWHSTAREQQVCQWRAGSCTSIWCWPREACLGGSLLCAP